MKLLTNIRLYKNQFTLCYVYPDIILPDQQTCELLGFKHETQVEGEIEHENVNNTPTKSLKLVANALFLRPFMMELKNSFAYRTIVLTHLSNISGKKSNETMILNLILEPPDQEVIDFAWNERMLKLLWMRLEIENAFSWLSTLGGAYSALGDYFERCADEAARISKQQYQLSKMLGDDSLAARSKLYLAIAFAQKGDLKQSRHITRDICAFSITTRDKRLNRMCKGVWAKLKYLRRLKNEERTKVSTADASKNGKNNI